jgi:hypothetical protein
MYFGTFDGHRIAFMVFDMPDSSDMAPFGEPFFMALDADVGGRPGNERRRPAEGVR